MRVYTFKQFKKILKRNGYRCERCNGSHFVYKKANNTIVINKNLNTAVAARLIKENRLIE